MAVVQFPSDNDIADAFQKYVCALGRVVHASNHFHEVLGSLYALLNHASREEAFRFWYKVKSDKDQRNLLRKSLETSLLDFGKYRSYADTEIRWLLQEADDAAEQRNDAVHAPCSLYVDEHGGRVGASFFNGNPRAINLRGKVIIDEFNFYEKIFETLTQYARDLETWICAPDEAVPNRPMMPLLEIEKERRLPQSHR